MNLLDFIILLIIVVSIIRGYKMGLIRQAVHLLGFVIALFVAYKFSSALSPYLQDYIPIPSFENSTFYMFSETFQLQTLFYNAIAFFLIFVVTKLMLNIGGHILHTIASLPGLNTINRLSGALIGLIQGLVLVLIIIHLISVMPWHELNQYVETSSIASSTMGLTPIFTELLYKLWSTTTTTPPSI